MRLSLQERLLSQEIGHKPSFAGLRSIYGNRQFIEDLDIINELEGHSGCVNALSWSRSGNLLASGSDDRTVNIYSYQPDQSSSQFSLATTIETSHSANIFSVKFMPNTNDSTIVTCAGDEEVRVFDIERSSSSTINRSRYSTSSANGKVFRSHNSAVKRLVTEGSPYYFLSCSEDGEVRQWDVRQPESSYPRRTPVFRRVGGPNTTDAPPPLISYAQYGIELWTISCSPTQPHYIALGGTHVHCFLHDRRMLGRNKLVERGATIARSLSVEASTEALSDATRCVAKFAPHGQPNMTKNDSGKNISACKLGTANPNELLVSWMGDYIYSFNISKDIPDCPPQQFSGHSSTSEHARSIDATKKRKRYTVQNEGSPSEGSNLRSRVEAESPSLPGYDIVVRVGGVAVPLPGQSSTQTPSGVEANGAVAHAQRIRTLKNALAKTHFAHASADRADEMAEILVSARQAFDKIDTHIAARTYPITNSRGAVEWELKLRGDRAKVWRYTQTSATLARVLLGYKMQPVHSARVREVNLESFDIVRPAPREGSQALDRHEHFGYDFIKAILLWLESGVGAVLREFSPESRFAARASRRRLPIPADAGIEALDTHLIPYLSNLAADIPVVYAGHGGAGDDPRTTDEVFASEKAAVRALGNAMKLQFEDLHSKQSNDDTGRLSSGRPVSHNREAALTFWGHRVCMAILNNASIDVNYPFVSTAFGHPRDHQAHSESMQQTSNSDDDLSDSERSHTDADASDDVEDSSDQESTYANKQKQKAHAARHVPASSHLRAYMGHCNVDTTKDVNFYGADDEYVVSGSDCGNFFIWDKKTGGLINILRGDNEVVNVIQPHPYEPMLAVSGIDSTVKIFSPDSRARRAARHAQGIARVDPRSFSSLTSRRRGRRGAGRNTTDRDTQTGDGEEETNAEEAEREWDEESSSDSEEVLPNGLESCRRMDDEYAISSENDMNRRSGNNQRYISRGVMELLAARLGARVDQLEDANSDCILM